MAWGMNTMGPTKPARKPIPPSQQAQRQADFMTLMACCRSLRVAVLSALGIAARRTRLLSGKPGIWGMVPGGGFEPPTLRFSVAEYVLTQTDRGGKRESAHHTKQ